MGSGATVAPISPSTPLAPNACPGCFPVPRAALDSRFAASFSHGAAAVPHSASGLGVATAGALADVPLPELLPPFWSGSHEPYTLVDVSELLPAEVDEPWGSGSTAVVAGATSRARRPDVVPEPAPIAMVAVGLAALAALRRSWLLRCPR